MSGYWELAISASEIVEEALTNFLWELGALGVVGEEASNRELRLRAFFPPAAAADLDARLLDYVAGLRALGLPAPHGPILSRLAEVDWAEAWRAHFRPLPVGRRLLIAPPWEAAAPGPRALIVIDPGRAFGTGHHASTVGCLESLEDIVERAVPHSAIDLGTGSGILAIAAIRLGVATVLAVDNDPDALACATANAGRNGMADGVRLLESDAGAVVSPPVGLVLANLLASAHFRLGPDYARYVAPGGALVLGGILDAEAAAVNAAVAGHGFVPDTIRSADGWSTVVLRRAR
ncbi:MAG TPA: 50S ribosomal protein L11 methyltransferase [Methylomirabilota bacterium]|nr:50S ribosomal protein L11 methyltransferase [Methylomirabilota bacterium]